MRNHRALEEARTAREGMTDFLKIGWIMQCEGKCHRGGQSFVRGFGVSHRPKVLLAQRRPAQRTRSRANVAPPAPLVARARSTLGRVLDVDPPSDRVGEAEINRCLQVLGGKYIEY